MNDFSQDKSARLLELLGQEIELFGQICELSGKQAELLAADDINAFNDSLDSRQEIIEEINGLHQETDILMQSYVSLTSADTRRKIYAIEKAIAQRHNLISECASLNKKNTISAKEKASNYTNRIDRLSLRRKSMERYAPDITYSSEMFDKKT